MLPKIKIRIYSLKCMQILHRNRNVKCAAPSIRLIDVSGRRENQEQNRLHNFRVFTTTKQSCGRFFSSDVSSHICNINDRCSLQQIKHWFRHPSSSCLRKAVCLSKTVLKHHIYIFAFIHSILKAQYNWSCKTTVRMLGVDS